MLLAVLLIAADAPGFAYKLSAPDRSSQLSRELKEISGISLAQDGASLWAVVDEKGTLYRIATKDGAVVQTIELTKKKGDFEGVAVVGDRVVAARSDGQLFIIDPKKEHEESRLTAPVGLGCDLEGFAYEPNKDRLLLACKSPGGSKGKAWPIYSLSLRSKDTPKEPVFEVSRQALKDYVETHPEQKNISKEVAKDLGPSALAVHPKSGEIYLLSSRASLLLVLSADGKVLHIEHLSRDIAPQAEGLAFAIDGTMFICSEARNKKPLLLVFAQKAN